MEIVSKFYPRPYQLKVLNALQSGIKRVVWVCHRRAGKDVTMLNWCISQLVSTTQTCFYVMPTYSQGKKVIWDSITNDGLRILDYFPSEFIAQKNNQEMKLRLKNGSLFQVIGSDNIDSLMGTNPKIVVFSEYALQDPAAWDYIRPILLVNKGVAIFISTPRGRNHFHELCLTAKTTPGWFYERLTIEDTGILTPEDMDQERLEGMSEELIQQEYYCSFDRGVEGSYSAQLLMEMREKGKIASFKHDSYRMTYTAFDLGWEDATAIIFFQFHGSDIHIIDCEEFNHTKLLHVKDILTKRGYKYGGHLFPHDVEQVDGLISGCTRKEYLEELQIPVTTVPKMPIADGIQAVRAIMTNRIHIDEGCKGLIRSLENYHRTWDDKKKIYNQHPHHDEYSHYCFVGETKIKTKFGSKRIDKLKVGELIKTPLGMRKILNIHVREVFETVEIKTSMNKIECTPEHDIFTQKGLIKSNALRYHTLEPYSVLRCKLWKILFGFCLKESDLKGFKKTILSQKINDKSSLMGSILDGMVFTTDEQSHHLIKPLHCIVQFGFSIMELFQKTWKYIIKTITNKIIIYPTWNYLTEATTNPIMRYVKIAGLNPKNVKIYSEVNQSWLRNGIDRKKEENGIKTMLKTPYLTLKKSDILSNVNGVKPIIQQCMHGKNSAQTDVKQKIGFIQKWIMKAVNVKYVNDLLMLISMPSKQHVVKSVELKKCNTPKKVYDLTIEEDGCYYANGYLASNCDAMRYLACGLYLIDSNPNASLANEAKALRSFWGG